MVVQTPTQSPRQVDAWEAKTPRNAREIEAQSTLIRQKVRNRPESSASSLDKQVAQLSKGAQQMAHKMTLMMEKMNSLQEALEGANKRKSRKRRYVRIEETLTVGDVQEVLAEQASSSRGDGESASKRVRGERRCGRCKQTGHNAHTCAIKVDNASDSDGSYG
ncbi:hypothetical protein PtrM4_055810 [Pyrenophora tritici-repentis]|uniref:CCHC-type domain-containing protein n=2 Tax=Pyrenophora tritici-repentis TaxID=45151 RepID=A0A834S150_9PLEO|nr:uncharacterized protein PTRG_11754 [Pyrenophora tritici-repentis Pt-1C-BFP]EDU44804.1 conserved hypothetical protein [Pyrenophora tritici-repentis Pt-1C-BFP]KAF7573958.1 hypothetical protein PtrM4_055810 [Pyrenophora tritici-repentis]KAI1507550.1 hypothetical protein Ptr86124_013484 [Pyrenophora tritici-repentis]KAI1685711.1 hypothetical protein KJE20_03676 [Pyrenophora tritici-repentis]